MQGTIINGEVHRGTALPAEILPRVGPDLFREAYKTGMSFSAWLEHQDPSDKYKDGLDAFSRLLHVAKIRTRSHAGMGLWADEFESFLVTPQKRCLLSEWTSRIMREMRTGQSANTRAIYTAADDIPGSSLRPYAEAATMRVSNPIALPFRLADLVAITTPISGGEFRSVYLATDATNLRLVRIAESADIPLFKLVTSTHVINLLKYGGGIGVTYEQLRRVRIDKVRFWLEQVALQGEMDKISQAINVLVSGDGNTATAATNWRAKTDLDAAATGKTITLKAWWAFKLKFAPLFALTHIVGVEGDITKLGLVNVGDSNMQVYLADPLRPSTDGTLRDGTRWGITADVPTDKLVGVDATRALEMAVEIGSSIQEIERIASNQTQNLYQTETLGFGVLQPGATKTLELET